MNGIDICLHQQVISGMMQTAIAIILTAVMMGLTWWSYIASNTLRNLRRINREQEARIQRLRLAMAERAHNNC